MKHEQKTVAVLGAGIIGANCAAELQSLGFKVTLIDKEGIGSGCSKGNAGHFATEQVFPLADPSLLVQVPKMLLDPLGPMALSPSYFPKALPWFLKFMRNMLSTRRNHNKEALKLINRDAIKYYKTLLKSAEAESLLSTNGSLLVFETTAIEEVKKHYELYKNEGIAVELLTREEVLALEPNLGDSINFALHFTEVAHTIDPYDVCQAIAQYAINLGANFHKASVSEIKETNDKVILSLENTESISTTNKFVKQSYDHLVVATGAWSKSLLGSMGYSLPLEVERGYSLNLQKIDKPELNRPVASAERKFIMTPMNHGLRLSGTVEFAGLKRKANMDRADMLYKHAKVLINDIAPFNESNAKDHQRWLGFRPSLPDSLPVISKATKHKHTYFALGHQHLGLTLGAITGKLIGQIMTNSETDIDISPFCISRFN